MVAKRSTRSTKIKTLNQIRHLGFTASDELRERFRGVSRFHLGAAAASLRPRSGSDPVTYATKTALAVLGRRVVALDEEKERLDELLAELVAKTAPQLLELHGVSTPPPLSWSPPATTPTGLRGGLGPPLRRCSHPRLVREGDAIG